MNFLGFFGALLLFFGTVHLRTYLQRKSWPVVEGTPDSVDVKIEAQVATEGVGLLVRPKYIYKIRYSYPGSPYVVEHSSYKVIEKSLKLRVNPEKPSEAFLYDKTLFLPVLAISIGIILTLCAIGNIFFH